MHPNRYIVYLVLGIVVMSKPLMAAEQVLLPIPSEQLLQRVSKVYLGLDDGGSGDDTYYIHENGTTSGTAGSVDATLPFDFGNAALHRNTYYSSYGGYVLRSLKRSYGLGPTTSYQTAYAVKTGNCLLYLQTLSSSTAEKARFSISAKPGDGKTYYLSRTKNAVKWYASRAKDQVAYQKNVMDMDTASAWTFYIVPKTDATGLTTTFDCGTYGTIEGEQPFRYENLAGVPWPTVQADTEHLFVGWYDNPEGTGDEYISTHSVCQNYYMPSVSTTLYAQYLTSIPDSIRIVGWSDHSLVIEHLGQAASISVRYASPSEDCGDLVHGGYSKEQVYSCSDIAIDQAIYELPISTTLSHMAGQHLILMLYDALNLPMGFVRVVIPDIVSDDAQSEQIVTRDVVLLSGATLHMNNDMALRSLSIHGGAKLVVPEGRQITVDSLVMRAGAVEGTRYLFTYPQMVVNGSLSTSNDTIYYDYLLNSDQYYGLAMPCPVASNRITYSNGKPAQYGLQTYHGAQRASTGSGWQTVLPDTLYPGTGYVIYAMPQQLAGNYRNYARVRFPMYAPMQAGERPDPGKVYRQVDVQPHGYSATTRRPNDVGWNLVGNPYLANYTQLGGLDGDNAVALLELDTTGYHWVDTHRYVVLPNADGSGYVSQQQSKTQLMAFQPFFVQVGDGDSLCFNLDSRAQQTPARRVTDNTALENAKQHARKLAEEGQFAYWDLDRANCTTGPVKNPFETQYNKVDYGYNDPRSRHTVHYVDELDSCTGNQLHTVLPDGRPAVRLGNVDWGKNSPYSGGECIQYEYQVTPENSILILYYAAVLQVPDHKAGKPHFSMDILRRTSWGTYYSIGEDCYSFDFTKDEISDWNCGSWKHTFLGKSQQNDSVCWKDWTAISINLMDYVGKTVYIRLSTQDCTQYGHFGYAYFGIDVAKCDIQLQSCGTSADQSVLSAPDYFLYAWYKTSSPSTIISTERSIEVPNDGTEYSCKVMNIENPDCYFTIQRQAVPNVPIANFDMDHRRGECVDTLILIDRSYVSSTPAGLDTLDAQCESATWTITDPLHRVSVYTGLKPDTIYLIAGGEYAVSMVAQWSEHLCESEAKEKTLVVNAGKQTLQVKDTICEGEYIEHGLQRHYTTGSYRDTVPSGLGDCHDTVIYDGYLHVHPVNVMPIEERVVCKGEHIMWQGMPYSEAGTYYDTLTNQYGCDSILGMHLRYIVNGIVQGSPLSVARRRHATAAPTIPTSWADPYPLTVDSTKLCHTVSYTWHDSTYARAGDYHKVLVNQHGCDSLAFLHVNLCYSTADEYDTICNNQLPHLWYGKESKDGDTTMLINHLGCDSIVTLHLTIYRVDSSEQSVTICDTETPYLWKGGQYSASGDYEFDTLTTHGCDSIITLHLTVHASGSSEQYESICYADRPYRWKGEQYSASGDYEFDTLTTHGCDSIITLHLWVSPPKQTILFDTTGVCDTLLPMMWRGHLFERPMQYIDMEYDGMGCDSVERIYRLDTVHCEPPCLSNLVYKKRQDLIFCDNGKHQFVAFQWYRNGQLMPGETKQYFYREEGIDSAKYFVEVTYADGLKRQTCPETMSDIMRSADTYVRVQTVIHRGGTMQISMSDSEAEVIIYTTTGQPVMQAAITGCEVSLPVPLPSGVYILQLQGTKVSTTTKLIVD